MSELVRGHMEVQTIHMVRGAFPMASENGAGRITDVFPIHILVADFLSCGVVLNPAMPVGQKYMGSACPGTHSPIAEQDSPHAVDLRTGRA